MNCVNMDTSEIPAEVEADIQTIWGSLQESPLKGPSTRELMSWYKHECFEKIDLGKKKASAWHGRDHGPIVLDIKLFEYLGTVRASGE